MSSPRSSPRSPLSPSYCVSDYIFLDNEDLPVANDDVFGRLRSYVDHEGASPGNTPEHNEIDSHDASEIVPAVSSGDQVLPFTRNLAQQVRQSFAGVSQGVEGAGSIQQQLSSFDSSSVSLPGASRPNQASVYNLNVILLDPGVDSIPRRSFRDNLRNNGRIVKLSLPRGAQGPETRRRLSSAFPLLRGIHTSSNEDDAFEVLVTDKTARNTLIPANSLASGFTARELYKIAGQGSLYLRLLEASSGQSQILGQTGSSSGSRSSPGFLFRQMHLPLVSTQVTGTSTSTVTVSASNATTRHPRLSGRVPRSNRAHVVSTSTTTRSTSSGPLGSGLSAMLHDSPGSRAVVHPGISSRFSRPAGARLWSPAAISSTSTRTTPLNTFTGAGSGMRSLDGFSRGRAPLTTSTSTRITATDTSASARSNTGGTRFTSTHTATNNSTTSAGSGSEPDRLYRVNAPPASQTSTHTSITSTAVTSSGAGSSTGGSMRVRAPSTIDVNSTVMIPVVITDTSNTTTTTASIASTRSTISGTSTATVQGPLSLSNRVEVAGGIMEDVPTHTTEVRQAAADVEAPLPVSSSEEYEDEVEERGRSWRTTLPTASADAGAGIGTGGSVTDNALPINSTSTRTTTTDTGPALRASVTTSGVSRPSVANSSSVVTGTIEVPEASVLLDLLPQYQGQSASALQSSLHMIQSTSLPFNHPCAFHVLMEMVRMDEELSRPALMCICSERQWLLWRPIFENREIANLVNNQFLLWVQPSDGAVGKQGLASLKDQSNSGVVAVVYSVGDRNEVLLKIAGPPNVGELKRALEEALKAFHEQKSRWLALKMERDLKRQQDLEYEASLNADREKETRKRNTKACQTDEEPIENPPPTEGIEPPQAESIEPPPKRLRSEELLRVIVVLPDGQRHSLDITWESTLQDLYQQVETLLPDDSEHVVLSYQIDGNIWRTVTHDHMTMREYGMEPNVVLRTIRTTSEANTSGESCGTQQ